ncbi:MAG: ArsI/CadI family heavy metal resistance metalloenzyme [Holophagaceae bacterium]
MQGVLKPHVSLNVSDLEASVAFYERAFGVAPTKLRPDYAKFDLQSPLLNLTMQRSGPTGVNADHFGIQVGSTADVAAAVAAFQAAGLATRVEDRTSCCYALQDKVWIADPDGNQWEVFTVLGEADRLHKSEGSTGACCAPGRAVTENVPATCQTPVACATSAASTGSCGCA